MEHLRVIQKFVRDLPDGIHPAEIEKAEAFLAEGHQLRPDQLHILAERLAIELNPRHLLRGLPRCPARLPMVRTPATRRHERGPPGSHPQLRAALDALFAKFAAPGMCNPPIKPLQVTTDPEPDVAARDHRLMPQRQHDA